MVIIGPVFPYRAGIAYCTTRLAEELAKVGPVEIVSFSRQFPRRFYPGGDDRDPTLESKRPSAARFSLDVLNPISWIREGLRLRSQRPETVILVWWIWLWAIPYLTILFFLYPGTRIILQCHNVGEKESAWWKRLLARLVFTRADLLIVHAQSEENELVRRMGERIRPRIRRLFLPVHELGGVPPSRSEARELLGITTSRVALFFGHVRPFKGLDIALEAWSLIKGDALLLVAGEVWWNDQQRYLDQVRSSGMESRVDLRFRFVPDSEIASYFAACDVVLAPYRTEAQSGVAMTAFHFARPVIASDVGGFPEIIEEGKNGHLVSAEDPKALALAVDTFFESGDPGSYENAARASAGKYSWAEYGSAVNQWLEPGS